MQNSWRNWTSSKRKRPNTNGGRTGGTVSGSAFVGETLAMWNGNGMEEAPIAGSVSQ